MKTKTTDFEVLIPNLDGTGTRESVKVPVTLEWDEEVKEWLLTAEAHQIIEETKARHIGLLLPAQLKELRERYDFTQKEMGELFQVGEKSWTRWESGKHRPSRSINLLMRALYEDEISLSYLLKCADKPPHFVESYENMLAHWFSYTTAATKMPYGVCTGEERINVQLKWGVESKILKALSSQPSGNSIVTWQCSGVGKSPGIKGLNNPKKRFDYENAKIA